MQSMYGRFMQHIDAKHNLSWSMAASCNPLAGHHADTAHYSPWTMATSLGLLWMPVAVPVVAMQPLACPSRPPCIVCIFPGIESPVSLLTHYLYPWSAISSVYTHGFVADLLAIVNDISLTTGEGIESPHIQRLLRGLSEVLSMPY